MDTIASSNPAPVLRIEGEFNIYRALELQASLQAALGASPQLDVDLSGVSEIDSAGVQLLIAATKSAQQEARTLRLTGHSPAVREVFELLGLNACFDEACSTPSTPAIAA